MAKNAIVTTTIFVPKLLDTYAEDAKKNTHLYGLIPLTELQEIMSVAIASGFFQMTRESMDDGRTKTE